MKRLTIKITFVLSIIVLSFFIGAVTNWFKLSVTVPISEVDKNIYLGDVDSIFVSNYGIKYECNYTYFIRGDLETKVFRGESFLSKRIITDTINVVLDKKITKKSLKPNN